LTQIKLHNDADWSVIPGLAGRRPQDSGPVQQVCRAPVAGRTTTLGAAAWRSSCATACTARGLKKTRACGGIGPCPCPCPRCRGVLRSARGRRRT